MKISNLKIFYILFVLLFNSKISYSQLSIANIFGDNMVLQQNEENYIWGWAKKNQKILLKSSWLTGELITATNEKGYWKIAIPVPKADLKQHTIEISAGITTITLENILFGEVWLCSGQSNMEMQVKGNANEPIIGSNEYIASSKNSFIRQCFVKQNYSATPLNDCEAKWEEAHLNTVANFTAVGYFFALQLYKSLQVPVGIVNTSKGGTRVEAWMDREILKNEFKETNLSEIGTDKMVFQTPTVLFNAMVNPLVGMRIKGVLWYQGESNIFGSPKKYYSLFPAMISRWRSLWGQGNFPFYYVQIAPFEYQKEKKSYVIRDAQLKTLDIIPNTGMATTNDVGDRWNIHPGQKKEVGDRLSYLALNKTYGYRNILCGGPIYKGMEIVKGSAILEFKNAPKGLTTFNKPLTGFLIAGADKVFYQAKAKVKIEYDKPHHKRRPLLEVYHEKVSNPVAVRYCWSNWFTGHLYDTGGNPASPFRTDSWDN
ncbi:sialate O-acetylesterase [Flavivirga algicola]|uniref:Sialate O-acetylesterase n=1 Tax=Flavivirga algicola TaxID=2729136 RepID=A0ABX1RV19_9FLAO|nr:sialate O-acetylesterase [Flavivirga algicola]NMH86623.1 sialate O-acetylesterase [Flavivirga algicola]